MAFGRRQLKIPPHSSTPDQTKMLSWVSGCQGFPWVLLCDIGGLALPPRGWIAYRVFTQHSEKLTPPFFLGAGENLVPEPPLQIQEALQERGGASGAQSQQQRFHGLQLTTVTRPLGHLFPLYSGPCPQSAAPAAPIQCLPQLPGRPHQLLVPCTEPEWTPLTAAATSAGHPAPCLPWAPAQPWGCVLSTRLA